MTPAQQQDPSPTSNAAPPRKRRRGRILIRLVIYLVLMYLVYCLVLYFYQDRLLFPRDMAPEPDWRTDRYDPRTAVLHVPIETGGEVVAWFIPARSASKDRPAPVAVFFHGNAEIIDYLDEIVTPYRKMGFSVLLPEYRGYGRAAGTPDEKSLIGDSLKLYDEMMKRADVDRARIVIHGRSLGGGPACAVAAQRSVSALILQSVFTNTCDMANHYGAPGFLARHPFHNDEIIPRLTIPILIAHGTIDEIVPVEQGRRLAKLARNATYLEYPCTHNGFPGDGKEDEYWGAIAAFLAKAGMGAGTPNE